MTEGKEVRHYAPNYFYNLSHPLRVTVVGAGGTGCIVAHFLLKMHVTLKAIGHRGLQVHLMDGGIVREANFGRQGFYEDDIGRKKTDVLAQRFNAAVGEYVFFSIPEHLCKQQFRPRGSMYNWEAAHTTNVIMGCTDTVESREIMHWLLREKKNSFHQQGIEHQIFYYLDFGNTLNTGQVIMGGKIITQPAETKEFKTRAKLPDAFEVMPESIKRASIQDKDNSPSCSVQEAIEKQDLFVNTSVALEGCHMFWQFIMNGYTTYNAVFINLETGKRGRRQL